MSAQFFISIITQSATLLHRGQTVTQMSSPNSHPEYYLAILLSLSLQIGFLYIRFLSIFCASVPDLRQGVESSARDGTVCRDGQ
jgi:hypothetical protein